MTKRGRFEPEAELRSSVIAMDYTIDHHPAPPFRVLSPGTPGSPYKPVPALRSPPPPPSSRAPEPYKLTTAQARSQRKSAFAIIAETPAPAPAVLRASSPESSSRPSSPSLALGSDRLSPFRGRGFKGPPPRSRSQHLSRPHSPSDDTGDDEGRSRQHRRVSISQQSSPIRSQIPRPARSRSISSSKENLSRKASPKFGRRATPKTDSNRYNSSIGNNNANNRRTTLKDAKKRSDLSPIQGTPTKVLTDRNNKVVGRKVGQIKSLATPRSKPGTTPNKKPPLLGGKRFITADSSESSAAQGRTTSDSPDSPSKIPTRRQGPNNVNSTSASSLSPAKSTASPAPRASKNPANQTTSSSDKPTTEESKETSATAPTSTTEDEPGLVDLLKQTTGATGTSSVVNTTTATAVQPLQIDAGSILAEGELVAKLTNLEKKQKSGEKSPDAQSKTSSGLKKAEPAVAANAKTKNPSPRSTPSEDVNSISSSVDNKTKSSDNAKDSKSEVDKPKDNSSKQSVQEKEDRQQTPSTNSSHKKSDSKSGSIAKSSNSGADSKKASPRMDSAEVQGRSGSSESLGSIRSTDTGVSVNTVRGVSSAKEKTGLVVKRSDEIETLSGNIVNHERNGDQALSGGDLGGGGGQEAKPATKWQRIKSDAWKRLNRVGVQRKGGGGCSCLCCPGMRCLACKRDHPKAQMWPGKKARTASTTHLTDKPLSKWDKFKDTTCRCTKLRSWMQARKTKRQQQRRQRENEEPPEGCCAGMNRRLGSLCRSMVPKCSCSWPSCNLPCGRNKDRMGKNAKSKPSLTSVQAPPLSEENRPKLPDVLIEHNSPMRGAIPCLPVPLAWLCLLLNLFIPGSGTVLSGLFNLCCGQPRFSATASPAARIGALVVNCIVGVSQLFTVLFCLVGWGWSVWWGVTMLRLARKYKRFKESEAVSNDLEARGPETATLPAPGVPPLRPGAERAAAR